ncbi:MAG TPA: acid-shock protein [Casimicrobiaceae bacterium]|nr:acid-shock protein [Casimicrobiaceae bacterium]
MKKLAALIAAGTFVLAPAAFAADAPKAAAGATTTSAPAMKMEKPASVTQEAWDKMTDAQKKDAVEKAKMAKKDSTSTTPMKKDKKGGC